MALTLRITSTHPLLPAPVSQRLDIAEGQELSAGRLATANLRFAVEDRRISRHHFSLRLNGGRLELVNHSLNGTIVDGMPIDGSVELGEDVSVGLGELIVRIEVSDGPTEKGPAPSAPPPPVATTDGSLDDATLLARPPTGTRPVAPKIRRGDLVGHEVGGYRFEAALSHGALGPRYRAVQTALERTVELQLVPRVLLEGHPGRIERLFRTARMAVRLIHPHAVQIHDCGELSDLDAYYMTTEHVDGVWLDARIAAGPMPMAPAEAIRIAREVGAALAHAHACNIVHRNVAPEHIVLARVSGAAKLSGLGLAKSLDDDTRLTRSGAVMGNLRYSAPEQLTDARSVDARADQYALAAVLYHLLTGRPRLEAKTLAEHLKAAAAQPRTTPPSSFVPSVAASVDRAVIRALAWSAEDRYPSVHAFLEALAGAERATSPDAAMLGRTRATYLAMLPRLPARTGIDWGVHFAPVDEVGGDFYDVFELGDGRLGAMVGDVAGHGLDAAMAVGMAKTSCRIYARTEGSPARALAAANSLVRPQLAQGRFFTCCLGMFDPEGMTFTFARGGHNPVLLHNASRNPSIHWLSPEGCAIGVMPDRAFHQVEHALYLEPGDLLLLFTDGVPEATNAAGEPFELDRLAALVAERDPAEPAGEIVSRIATALGAWCGGAADDDVTLLALRLA